MPPEFFKRLYQKRNTSAPISEITQKVGYKNQGFFYKKFQAYYNMSPIEYRKSLKKNLS
ncbi:AraC family transcriptional regulator [Petralouisia muris]|uniref:AraC family transcriptional regulator n=1 Tax=Petralouisia muris TaxID=3032872 RepID=A0AC61RSX1_9FIRM|nr:AraC family transcriptional regulator [Petralouisia muris]